MTTDPPLGRSPRKAWGPFCYVFALGVIWVILLFVARDWVMLPIHDLPGLGLLFALAIVSLWSRDSADKGASNSFTTVVLLACVVIYGPLAAGLLGIVLAMTDRTYGVSIVSAFNAVMIGAMTAAGGVVYHLAGGSTMLPGAIGAAQLLLQVGLPLLAADLAMCAVNVLALVGMFAVTGRNTHNLLVGSVRELVPLFVGYALVAFVWVLLWGPAGVGPLSAVLIAAPLAIARFVYVQYGDELRAHERIIAMLTRAGDGPDGRVAAHGARVDQLCQLIAAQLGLGEHDRKVLSQAAHLHDIAMKAVLRATDTQRGGTGPYTNVQALIPHPVLAAQIVSGVHFLADAAAPIRSHHERMDGRGYPDGLAGAQIPLTARILAVADAFDALTTTRGERAALDTHAALAELSLSAGTHLDRRVLQALGNVLGGREQPLYDDPVNEGSWLWDHHTLPAMSDVIADEVAAAGPAGRATAEPAPPHPPDGAVPPSSLGRLTRDATPRDHAPRTTGSHTRRPKTTRRRPESLR